MLSDDVGALSASVKVLPLAITNGLETFKYITKASVVAIGGSMVLGGLIGRWKNYS